MASSEISLEAVPSVSDMPAVEWDACANPKPDLNSLENIEEETIRETYWLCFCVQVDEFRR